MDLFHLQAEAHGSVFWHPRGWVIWRQLEAYMRRRLDAAGYNEIKTPQLIDSDLWVRSGHWAKFRANMFVVPDEVPSTEEGKPVITGNAELMALKPMNCPAHIQVFKQGITSYKELPIRLAEYGTCHRNEPHGALHGIMRVRQFTQDDGHIFCTHDQLVGRPRRSARCSTCVYRDLGFADYQVKLATRPDERIGSNAEWDRAEADLETGAQGNRARLCGARRRGRLLRPQARVPFDRCDRPNLAMRHAPARPEHAAEARCDLHWRGWREANPLMLHRAILGTFERFIGILIEHYAGKVPLWLAPVQAVVATIVSDADAYAGEVAAKLAAAGIRVETDHRNETINYKVREHSLAKVPLLLVVGKREAEAGTVALRRLGSDEHQKMMSVDDAVAMIGNEAVPPDLRA